MEESFYKGKEHGERIARLEVITDDHKDEINRLKDDNQLLHRLTVLMEENSKRDEKRDLRLESFDNTLQNVNENLTNLNRSQEKIQQDISTISSRVEKVEKIQKEDKEKYSINLKGLPKTAIIKTVAKLGALAFLVLSAWVLYKLNLK